MAAYNNQYACNNLSNNDTSMKFDGFKSQMTLYPKQLLGMKEIQYGGYNPRWRLTIIKMLENLEMKLINSISVFIFANYYYNNYMTIMNGTYYIFDVIEQYIKVGTGMMYMGVWYVYMCIYLCIHFCSHIFLEQGK